MEKELKAKGLDWDEIKDRLSALGTCEQSRDRLRDLNPLKSSEEVEQRYIEIAEALMMFRSGKRPFMESLDLFSIWFSRLEKDAVLKTTELRDTRHFLIEALALKEITKEAPGPWLQDIEKSLMPAEEPLSAIDQIMTPDGGIRTDASETLYKLYQEKTLVVRQVQSTLDKLIHKHEMEPVLQDRYVTNRDGRWVLPVKSGKQHDFSGLIHASSQSKQTVFMEPQEIVPMNNRLREVEVEIESEIERLLTQLSDYLRTRIGEMSRSQQRMLLCDQRWAQAQLAAQMTAHPVEFDQKIKLIDLRHPLLVLNNIEVIPNSVEMDEHRRILLLSGPNAGGKTVLLKSVGLAAQMARCGLFVCAEPGSKIPFFNEIHVAIGDSQSVDENLSTFAAHLKILNEALSASGYQSLLLIDEICGSTDPEEGTALARAFIEAYSRNGTFGVITSHLSPLKVGWSEDSGVINGSLAYDNKVGKPTFLFLMGVPGQSLAIQTAKRVGVSQELVDQALKHLSPEAKKYHLGLEEVENMKGELQHLRENLRAQIKQANVDQSKYRSLSEKFEREREKMLDQVMKRAEKKVETLIEHSKVDDVFKKFERLEKIKTELPEIVKASKTTSTSSLQIMSAEDFSKAYPSGTRVFVPTIGRDGVIQGSPNSKGEVPILSQSMRLMIHWEQLRPPNQANNPTREVLRRVGDVGVSIDVDRDPTVDLRGQQVEEALQLLESSLDRAVLASEDRLKVIHGHGTEALKKAIRGYLSRSVYVKNWKAGSKESGGDGITWVEINY